MTKQRNLLIKPCLCILIASLWLTGCDRAQAPVRSIEVAVKGNHGAALSDNGEHAVIGSINHGGSLWRTNDGERLYNWNHKQGESTTIVAADFSPDGRWAITADVHSLVLWNMQNGEGFRYWSAPGEILDVSLSPDGDFALLGLSDHTAVIFDAKRGGVKRTFQHQNRVRSVDYSNDGKRVITGSEDYSAITWNLSSGKALSKLQHDEDVQMVALSADGKMAFSMAKYDKAALWHSDTGKIIAEVPLAGQAFKRGVLFTAAKFSHDGRFLATGRPDQIVELWDTKPQGKNKKLKAIARWRIPKRDAWQPTSSAVIALSFSQNDKLLYAVASNGFIHELRY